MLVGRLSTSRAVGKGVFFLLRQSLHTIQGVMFQGDRWWLWWLWLWWWWLSMMMMIENDDHDWVWGPSYDHDVLFIVMISIMVVAAGGSCDRIVYVFIMESSDDENEAYYKNDR